MPKYYFDLVDGTRSVDPAGLDCRDDHDANKKAEVIADQVAADAPVIVERKIEVLDEEGDAVAVVPIHEKALTQPVNT